MRDPELSPTVYRVYWHIDGKVYGGLDYHTRQGATKFAAKMTAYGAATEIREIVK